MIVVISLCFFRKGRSTSPTHRKDDCQVLNHVRALHTPERRKPQKINCFSCWASNPKPEIQEHPVQGDVQLDHPNSEDVFSGGTLEHWSVPSFRLHWISVEILFEFNKDLKKEILDGLEHNVGVFKSLFRSGWKRETIKQVVSEGRLIRHVYRFSPSELRILRKRAGLWWCQWYQANTFQWGQRQVMQHKKNKIHVLGEESHLCFFVSFPPALMWKVCCGEKDLVFWETSPVLEVPVGLLDFAIPWFEGLFSSGQTTRWSSCHTFFNFWCHLTHSIPFAENWQTFLFIVSCLNKIHSRYYLGA